MGILIILIVISCMYVVGSCQISRMTRKHMGRLNKNIECVKARESSLDSDRIELFYLMIKYAEAEPSSRYELAVKMCDIKEKIRVKTSIIAKHIAVNQTIKIGK